jgi:PPOX class probable F420-dependent enzyme
MISFVMTPSERLADTRIRAFLDSIEVVVLATVGPGGAPQATPMWFLPGSDTLSMISVDGLQKIRNLRRDPRVSVVAETTTPEGDIRGVTVGGRAEFLPDSAERRRLVERFLERYHPRLERIWRGRAMPADRVMFRITPERVRAWGLS